MDVIHGVKSAMGHAMRPLHAGSEKLISHDPQMRPRYGVSLSVQSPVFEANGMIPRKYSAEGDNTSPPLRWSDMPQDTRELVLICEDPDAPKTEPFIHWILYGLAPDRTSLPEGVPTMEVLASLDGARQGKNSGDHIGYMGPMPPVGHGIHHYHFQLFALDRPSRLESSPERPDLIAAMSGHVLAMGDLVGTYERK